MLFLEGLFGPGIFRNTLVSLPLRPEMTRARVQSAITRLQQRQEALRSSLVGRAPYLQRTEAVDPRLRTVIARPGERGSCWPPGKPIAWCRLRCARSPVARSTS